MVYSQLRITVSEVDLVTQKILCYIVKMQKKNLEKQNYIIKKQTESSFSYIMAV